MPRRGLEASVIWGESQSLKRRSAGQLARHPALHRGAFGQPQAGLSKSSCLEVPRPLRLGGCGGGGAAQAGVDGNVPWSTAFGHSGHPIETRGLQGSTYSRS